MSKPVGNETLSAGEVSRIAARVLGNIHFPALILEVPSERIIAASPAATRLLDPEGGMVVGQLLKEYTVDRPTLGADLFAGGRLNGVQTSRTLRRRAGEDEKVPMWIRSFERQPASTFVVAVFEPDAALPASDEPADWREAPAVVGTADASLIIERISSDAEVLFDLPVAELLGRSLLALVAPEAVGRCLSALGEAAASQNGVTLHLDIRGAAAHPLRCEVLILPLEPSPSCSFVFLPIAAGTDGGDESDALSPILLRLRRGAEVARVGRGVFGARIPGLSRLTTRELEIVTRLLEGDRPPAIAETLFLSQSTVRNHLASVFAKLDVNSQQQLLGLFRTD
jgi:DNA-binding CsgD family transcriptional regulator